MTKMTLNDIYNQKQTGNAIIDKIRGFFGGHNIVATLYRYGINSINVKVFLQ